VAPPHRLGLLSIDREFPDRPATPAERRWFATYRAAARVAQVLPLSLANAAAEISGLVFTLTGRRKRSNITAALRRVCPELEGLALQRAVERAFASYGRYWMECFRAPVIPRAELEAHMSYEGFDNLYAGLARGKGVILALPHLGSWDYGGAWLAAVGHPMTVVAEPARPPEMFEWFARMRRSMGLTVVPLDRHAGTVVLRTLRAGGLVGLLSDRNLGRGGVEVDLFGRTTLPAGPATLALRGGAALMTAAVYTRPRGQHLAVIGPPIVADRQGHLRDDVTRVTKAMAADLETLIRRAPEQWHLFQPNWPDDPGYGA